MYSYDRRLAAATPFDAERLEGIQRDVETFLQNYDRVQTEQDFDRLFRATVVWRKKLDRDYRAVERFLRDAAMNDPKVKDLDRQLNIWRKKLHPLWEVRHAINPTNWEHWNADPPWSGKRKWRNELQQALKGFPAMIKWLTGLGKRRKIRPVTQDVTERNFSVDGFPAMAIGFDPDDPKHVKALANLRTGLKHFKSQAQRYMPILLKKMVPMVLHFNVEDLPGRQGQLGDGNINVYPLNISKPVNFVHTVAHELAHHHHHNIIPHQAWAAWIKLFRGDFGNLDLNEVLAKWPVGSPDLDWFKLRTEDPVLYIQMWALSAGHIKAVPPQLKDDWRRENIQRYLDEGGNPNLRVPMSPTTPYGASKPEEAFAEAVGMLVAYGPRAVHPTVRRWLQVVMPGVVKLGSAV